MKIILLFVITLTFFSCKNDVTKNSNNKENKQQNYKTQALKDSLDLSPKAIVNTLDLEGGIKVKYFSHGNGPKINNGEVVKLNYKVLLPDGELVDGNELLSRKFLPFLVGFGMQTPGWDIVLPKLNIGDFVEIYLPAKMARGEKGIKGLIPPNSPNIIRMKILGKINPTRTVDGTKVYLLEENKQQKVKIDVDNTVTFHYMVGTPSNPRYDMSYKKNMPYELKFSDYGIVKGLKKSLINAKKSDKLWIVIPPKEAYGTKGLMDLVKANEYVFYDIFILDVR